jgi:hypothetical protein
MKKLTKLTSGQKVLQFVRKNPNAKAKEVSKATGVNINSVYQAIYRYRKESKLPSTTAPNAQMSLVLFSDPPKKRGRPTKVLSKISPREEVVDKLAHMNKVLGKQDMVNHPSHYKVGGIETIDFIEAKSLSYNLGNVVKYLTRADHKGNKLEDLKKAQWYLNREISKQGK